MDIMNFMQNVQPAAEKPVLKPNADSMEKGALKNSASNAESQEKDFGGVLDEAVKQAGNTVAPESEPKEDLNELPLMAAVVPAVILDIAQALKPITAAKSGETEVGVLPKEVGQLQLSQDTNIQQTNKLSAFAGDIENLLVPKEPQPQAAPAIVVVSENKPNGQELLHMLNSKGADVKMQTALEQDNVRQNVQLQQQVPADPKIQSNQSAVMSPKTFSTEESMEGVPAGRESDVKPPVLERQNFFFSDEESKDGAQNPEQKTPLHEAKQPKAAAAKLVNEPMLQDGKEAGKQKALRLPENMSSQDNVKGNTLTFAANSFEIKEMPGQPSSQAALTKAPEDMAKYKVADQIIEQAKLIKTTEDTQMVIKLRPEHLGDLTLKVTVENGVVSATFHSDNASVRSLIETSLFQLKQELAAQGVKVDNVGVYAGLGEFMSKGQEQANSGQQGSKSKNRKIDLAEFDEAPETTGKETLNDRLSADGVDYRV